jgi:hypothetical protein
MHPDEITPERFAPAVAAITTALDTLDTQAERAELLATLTSPPSPERSRSGWPRTKPALPNTKSSRPWPPRRGATGSTRCPRVVTVRWRGSTSTRTRAVANLSERLYLAGAFSGPCSWSAINASRGSG